ncbi:MAG: sodium:proton antiporter [Oculatellaceae cyanobacterium Prado106]|jgi:NhaP-type Na+/H+ or K+/H+ antiporter|nr:sodium:proton antiporter [Oculatellaceae cyanobacterium Prado106]
MSVDIYILDLLVIGLLLLFVTLGSGWITRLPLSYALIYLVIGIILSPYGFNLIQIRPGTEFLERATELVVLISLFSCGLKMNRPMRAWAWNSTVRLIGLLMPISIFGVAAIAYWLLDQDWGTAILLGAILAPTDPVLASEVQLSDPQDRDELRFGLTSEGGLNDALAFPFVYFGLHWIENDNLQEWVVQWVAVDLVWAIAAGFVMGIVVPRAIVWVDKRLQRYRATDSLMEDFIALGIVLITYALTEVVNGYGFLAVFVAGMVTWQSYRDPERHDSQLEFVERIEKLAEVGIILLLGSLLRVEPMLRFLPQGLLIAASLLFVIRPFGAWVSTLGKSYSRTRRFLFGWFGIRGVGSLYYLSYALGEGLRDEVGEAIAWITFITIVTSVVVHGVSSTPLMRWYERRTASRV